MSRYAAMFDRLAGKGEGALGAFLMLGDPDLDTSARLLDQVVAAGADMVEVGIPFSDPIADGPVIQDGVRRALDSGFRVADAFAMIDGFRATHPEVPLGILTYANLVVARGRKRFFDEAARSGTDSLLIADVPTFEAAPWVKEMRNACLDPILIAAANTPPVALQAIAQMSGGYTYCVSRAGITGTHASGQFSDRLTGQLRELDAPPPIFGFGIASADDVRAAMSAGASGVICGSAIVACAYRGGDVAALVASLKAGTRNESLGN